MRSINKSTHLFVSRILFVAIFGLLILLFIGCASKQVSPFQISRLEQAYATSFFGVTMPDIAIVKSKGAKMMLSNLPRREDVKHAAMLVIMQRGPLLKASEENGLIFAPPFVVYLEGSQPVRVYTYFMAELYKDASDHSKDVAKAKLSSDDIDEYQKILLLQVATQAEAAQKLNTGGEWSYLKE